MITDGSSAHRVENFSTTDVTHMNGIKIQRLPAGEAIGSMISSDGATVDLPA
jgi:hypothetical protein